MPKREIINYNKLKSPWTNHALSKTPKAVTNAADHPDPAMKAQLDLGNRLLDENNPEEALLVFESLLAKCEVEKQEKEQKEEKEERRREEEEEEALAVHDSLGGVEADILVRKISRKGQSLEFAGHWGFCPHSRGGEDMTVTDEHGKELVIFKGKQAEVAGTIKTGFRQIPNEQLEFYRKRREDVKSTDWDSACIHPVERARHFTHTHTTTTTDTCGSPWAMMIPYFTIDAVPGETSAVQNDARLRKY